jgi:hypothetical protein
MRRLGYTHSVRLKANERFEIIANVRRVALLFSPPAPENAFYTVSTDPGVEVGAGLNLAPGVGGVTITDELYGEAVQKSWYAIAPEEMTIAYLEGLSGG